MTTQNITPEMRAEIARAEKDNWNIVCSSENPIPEIYDAVRNVRRYSEIVDYFDKNPQCLTMENKQYLAAVKVRLEHELTRIPGETFFSGE